MRNSNPQLARLEVAVSADCTNRPSQDILDAFLNCNLQICFKRICCKRPSGAEGIRTPNLSRARRVRCQLRHGPKRREMKPGPRKEVFNESRRRGGDSLPTRCWSRLSDSNRAPALYKSAALPNELRRQSAIRDLNPLQRLGRALCYRYINRTG